MLRHVHPLTWLLLLATLVGGNLVVYQTLLVPQTSNYRPDWYGARWISVPHPISPVAFYRRSLTLTALPNRAFITVQGSQAYTLYANGHLLDMTLNEFQSGAVNLAHIYDITSFLHTGMNTIALCAVNYDNGVPAVRAVVGLASGQQLQAFPSDRTWRATDNVQLVGQPCASQAHPQWSMPQFNDAAWQSAAYFFGTVPPDGVLTVNPVPFMTSLPLTWLTAGPTTDAFFYHSLTLPAAHDAWLRLAATGTADLFVNGHLLAIQSAHLVATHTTVTVTTDLYNLQPFLHAGQNNLAVHVMTVGALTQHGTFQIPPAAMLLDLFVTAPNGALTHIVADSSWAASTTANDGWIIGNGIAAWGSAITLGSPAPGVSTIQPGMLHLASTAGSDASATGIVALITTVLLLLAWLIAVGVQCGRYWSTVACAAALDRVALACTPALALLALLYALSWEPLLPHPFPFTRFWLGVLAGTAFGTLVLVLVANRFRAPAQDAAPGAPVHVSGWRALSTIAIVGTVILLTAAAIFLITYQLPYESYWQDELVSISAAQGVLHYGIPRWPTGVIYTKGELYSYLLALVIAIAGDGPNATRAISTVECIACLLLVFFLGRALLGRRIGLLAMLLLLCTPMTLEWGREARMYQQAQLGVLVVCYLFYRAIQPDARWRYIYLSMLAVVAMYLSHEETFIVLPAILLIFLVTQRWAGLRNPHWWIAGMLAAAVILLQLLIWQATRHLILGTDRSEKPLIAFNPQNVFFYARLLFASRSLRHGALPNLTVLSTLAFSGGLIALFSRDRALRYLSAFLFISLLCLSLALSLTSSRYIYPLLPLFALLAAVTIARLGTLVSWLAQQRLPLITGYALTTVFLGLFIGAVVVGEVVPITNFSLAMSRTFGLPYRHHFDDYQRAGAYIRAHWQPGDLLITLAPAVDARFYAVQPDYILYQGNALYILELHDHIVDSYVGATVLLNEHDLETILAQHRRIWLFAATGHLRWKGRSGMALIRQNFALVFSGEDTYVYFRSG